jgi:hypothetical protein
MYFLAHLITTLLIIFPLRSQWVQTTGPTGGSIVAMYVFNSVVYAAIEQGGVFRSIDNGTTWNPITGDITGRAVNSFIGDQSGTILCAGTLGYGIYASTNNGVTWAQSDMTLLNGGNFVYALNRIGNDLYAGTDGGVYRRASGASTWSRVPTTGLVNLCVRSLAVSGTNLYAGTDGGVYMTTNSGTIWTAKNTGMPTTHINALMFNGSYLYAGTDNYVYRSSDNGTSWNQMKTGMTQSSVLCLASSGTYIIAGLYGFYDTINRTSDNGTNWTSNSDISGSVYSLVFSGGYMIAGTQNGIYRTADNGTNWYASNTGLTAAVVTALIYHGSKLIVAVNTGAEYYSTNNGTTWNSMIIRSSYAITRFAVSGTDIYAGGTDTLFRSTDYGTTWKSYGSKKSGSSYTDEIIVNGGTIFLGTRDSGIYRSTNNGTGWTRKNVGLTDLTITGFAVIGSSIFAGTDSDGVFLSIDNGDNWSAVNNGLTNTFVRSLALIDTDLFAATYGGGIYRSSDFGVTWTAVNSGLPQTRFREMIASGQNLIAGAVGDAYHSSDRGATWANLSSGLPITLVYGFTVNDKNLFVGMSGRSVLKLYVDALPVELISFTAFSEKNSVSLHWSTATETNNYGFEVERKQISLPMQGENRPPGNTDEFATIGFVEGNGTSNTAHSYSFIDKNLSAGNYSYRLKQTDRNGKFRYSQDAVATIGGAPLVFSLRQNYPNPSNPSTTISYAIPTRSHVILSVFNTLGQKVAELVNGDKEAGVYDVTLDASGLSSGMYLYRMQAGNYIQTRKLIVVK